MIFLIFKIIQNLFCFLSVCVEISFDVGPESFSIQCHNFEIYDFQLLHLKNYYEMFCNQFQVQTLDVINIYLRENNQASLLSFSSYDIRI